MPPRPRPAWKPVPPLGGLLKSPTETVKKASKAYSGGNLIISVDSGLLIVQTQNGDAANMSPHRRCTPAVVNDVMVADPLVVYPRRSSELRILADGQLETAYVLQSFAKNTR
ncbi:hypothetical protein HG530_013095 [Fusarium avenaceum]|nr:hypothetical protein HG530_013095 [Fusarium avenaceum]